METELSKAIKVLQEALKEDEGYYQSWKANIAMAYQDEISSAKQKNKTVCNCSGCTGKISNQAADRFLKQLIS